MNVKNTRVRLLVAILTVTLMFSLLAVSAFAETSNGEAVSSTPVTEESTPAGSSESGATSSSAKPESSSTPAASSTAASTTGSSGSSAKDNTTDTIISLIIGGVIILTIVIVCIIKREPLGKFMHSLKSELGKVVWLPKNQTLKNTVVVLIIVAACAIVIGIVDVAFGQGIKLLGDIF